MLSIADISVIIAALGVLIGVIQYVLQMRYQTKIMRSDALVRLYSTTNSEDVLESYWVVSNIRVTDYEGYVNQFGSPFSKNEHADIHKAMMKVLGIYDLVGNLLYKNLIDFDLVYTVVGIDLSESLLKWGREKASAQKVRIVFQKEDARNLSFLHEFNLVIMICEGAFPLMETDEMNFHILQNAAKALLPKGKLILTTLNGLFPLFHSVKDFLHSETKEGNAKCEGLSFDLMTFRQHSTL